jgi:enoyl-CoA hydratase/carnithine racemase
MELVLADRTLGADKAQQMGLVSRLVDDAQWDSAISLALGELSKVSQSGQNKTLLRESSQVSLAEQLRSEQERFLEAARGDTFRARLREFLDRKA